MQQQPLHHDLQQQPLHHDLQQQPLHPDDFKPVHATVSQKDNLGK